ncbi:MAG: type II secretion system protein [Fibrobacteraceae bacterium]|nr:type II secretion system protein [Fibrobacteraceae bacterium]
MWRYVKEKNGFGIVEVLVSAAVLGFLLVALLNLQGGNRDSLLRLRGRDGAVEVAQQIIDSLNRSGLSSMGNAEEVTLHFGDENYNYNIVDKDGNASESAGLRNMMVRTWEGQPGLVKNTMTVKYRAVVKVSPDKDYVAQSSTMLESVRHVYAKQVNVKVFWTFKATEFSIDVSGVVK